MAGEKTEKATPHRKQEARKKGDGVRSRELTSALGTLAGVLTLGALAGSFAVSWRGVLQQVLLYSTHADLAQGEGAVMGDLVRGIVVQTWVPVALVLGAALAATLVAGVAQGGGLQFNAEALAFKADRINPVTNLGNIFSLRSAARLGKSLVPAGLVLFVGMYSMEQDVFSLPVLSLGRIPALLHAQYHMLLVASVIFLGWSALDYLVEWRSWEQRLRMSHEEMREEYKQTEGNPQVRGRIRSLQRQLRRRKQMADVSKASVVITNPTHYAVALSFDFETMQAPKVLAKGRNLYAEQIKQTARWAGVPIVENPPLARSLYRSVEPGQSIPQDLYAAVAAILAFLYRQRVQEKMREEDRQRAQGRARNSARQQQQHTQRSSAATQQETAAAWLHLPALTADTGAENPEADPEMPDTVQTKGPEQEQDDLPTEGEDA
jgi:flagellar biosynthetic protein FlhB